MNFRDMAIRGSRKLASSKCIWRRSPTDSYMIRAYFDDSGSESLSSGGHVCLAGYLADDHYWVTFNRLWRHQLVRHGIDCVHMKDLIPLQGGYKKLGWDATKRDRVINDFIRVIQYSELT